MYIRVGQFRFLNPNLMTYAMKQMLQENEEIYKKEKLIRVIVVKISDDKLANLAIWEKKPSQAVLSKLEQSYRDHSSKFQFQSVLSAGDVELHWSNDEGWITSNV